MYIVTPWSVTQIEDTKTKPVYVKASDFINLMNNEDLRRDFLAGLNKQQVVVEPIFDTASEGVKETYRMVEGKGRLPFRVTFPNMGWRLGNGNYR